ncbi:MAG: SprT-like family protein [Planctomycetaceae bacterium]|nr:hypothetical protein [Planctomycetaceae bacterium]
MEIRSANVSPLEAAARVAEIRAAILGGPGNIRQGNFDCIGEGDLQRLFDLYDREFFSGALAAGAAEQTGRPLRLRLSSRMTRAGGKTIVHRRGRGRSARSAQYEIAISAAMLLRALRFSDEPVEVCGRPCSDRLEALQRIMEHEIVHLAQLLSGKSSRCGTKAFMEIAGGLFAHRSHTHALNVRPAAAKPQAAQEAVRAGQHVEFDFRGRRFRGVVNRITTRATILVENPSGRRFSDGKCYQKFYVPLAMLKVLHPELTEHDGTSEA